MRQKRECAMRGGGSSEEKAMSKRRRQESKLGRRQYANSAMDTPQSGSAERDMVGWGPNLGSSPPAKEAVHLPEVVVHC
jgi:hypothetical protein